MKDSQKQLDSSIKTILTFNSFLLVSHSQPDGDAIGSVLGLAAALKTRAEHVHAAWTEDVIEIPPQYEFLPGVSEYKKPDDVWDGYDCVIALDCANIDRLGKMEALAKKSKCLINIDHHAENTCFGTLNIVDESCSSTAEIILYIIKYLGIKINDDIATCIYTGIVTDTGRFQYSNTNDVVFRIAAELIGYGIDPNQLFQKIYENKSLGAVRLLGAVLSRIVMLKENTVAYSIIKEEDFKKYGTLESETENYIDYLRSIETVKMAIIFKENKTIGWRVSMRSKNELDAGAIARYFKGGGHRNAAGFTSPYDIRETVDKVIELMEKKE